MIKARKIYGIAVFVCTFFIAISAAAAAPASDSIYQLPMTLTTQRGETAKLDLDRGHPVLISMFYASCPAICPTLIEHIKMLEQQLPESQRQRLRVVLVSFDPVRDTPAALARLAEFHHVDLSRWTLASTRAEDVRLLAATLSIQYRQLPDGSFDHSTSILLLDGDGVIRARSHSLGQTSADLADPLLQATAEPTGQR